ncbi:MAG: hypothetical protein LVQ95_03595 [Candidatus Micrarchaeales archaeon]|nr:hypothetical protein [Candidatus Micrarchaeales archaeon]
MAVPMKLKIAVLMGIIIALADIYWTYTSYFDTTWLALGVIIFIADIVWLWIDIGMMK